MELVQDSLKTIAALDFGVVHLSHSHHKERNAVSYFKKLDLEEAFSVKQEFVAHQIGLTNGQKPKNETKNDSMILSHRLFNII